MVNQISLVQGDLSRAIMSLEKNEKFTGQQAQYSFPADSRVYDLLGEGQITEAVFILHKLAPELELVDLSPEKITLQLKKS